MFKYFFSALLGFVVAMLCVMAIAVTSQKVWPPPAGLTATSDKETLRTAVASMPAGALLTAAGSWLAAAFAGGLVASIVSRSAVPAYIVGAFVIMAAVSNMMAIPYPGWFWFVALVLVPATSVAAARLGGRRRAQPD